MTLIRVLKQLLTKRRSGAATREPRCCRSTHSCVQPVQHARWCYAHIWVAPLPAPSDPLPRWQRLELSRYLPPSPAAPSALDSNLINRDLDSRFSLFITHWVGGNR